MIKLLPSPRFWFRRQRGRQPDAEIVPWLMGQEAALALPFPLQEAAMSWQQRGDHWLLACLPNDQLDRWIDTFAMAGMLQRVHR